MQQAEPTTAGIEGTIKTCTREPKRTCAFKCLNTKITAQYVAACRQKNATAVNCNPDRRPLEFYEKGSGTNERERLDDYPTIEVYFC